jgi:putative phosphoserine phosphatase/1-acylglycerol-3-phosphate O-acyltransferase
MESAGIVLIDRQDTAGSIEALTKLVDTMRVEGKSVCLSPEGTRAFTPKLAKFKKGAFHLAIQAGAPIVPIVIHNSNDVQPKGDMIFHPGTVDVEVLPPIDTSKWSASTIDTHIKEVRNQYLQALDQKKTEQKPESKPKQETKAKPKMKQTKARKRAPSKSKPASAGEPGSTMPSWSI